MQTEKERWLTEHNPISMAIRNKKDGQIDLDVVWNLLYGLILSWGDIKGDQILLQTYDGTMWVPKHDIEMMVNCVLSDFLIAWIKNKNNSCHTCKDYLQKGYAEDEDAPTIKLDEKPLDSERKALERANKAYDAVKEMLELMMQMIYDDPELTFKKKENESWISLNWMDQWCSGELTLLDLFFRKKEFLQTTGEKDLYVPLANAVRAYQAGLQKVRQEYHGSAGETKLGRNKALRKYVIANMQAADFEGMMMLNFMLEIADYCTKTFSNRPTGKRYLYDCYTTARFDSEVYGINGVATNKNVIEYPINLLQQKDEVYKLFTADENGAEYELRKRYALREKALLLEKVVQKLLIPKEIPSWTVKDFEQAAKFYEQRYPVLNQIADFDLPEEDSIYEELQPGQVRRKKKENPNIFYKHLWEAYDARRHMYMGVAEYTRKDLKKRMENITK